PAIAGLGGRSPSPVAAQRGRREPVSSAPTSLAKRGRGTAGRGPLAGRSAGGGGGRPRARSGRLESFRRHARLAGRSPPPPPALRPAIAGLGGRSPSPVAA